MKKVLLGLSLLVSINALAMLPQEVEEEEAQEQAQEELMRAITWLSPEDVQRKEWQEKKKEVVRLFKDLKAAGAKGESLIQICAEVLASIVPLGSSYSEVLNTVKELMPMLHEDICRHIANTKRPMLPVNQYNAKGEIQLIGAVATRNIQRVLQLLEEGALVTQANARGFTPLHQAAVTAEALIGLLLLEGANVHAQNMFGNTPLHCAALACNHIAVRALCEAGADINAKNKSKQTPLQVLLYNYVNDFIAGEEACIATMRALIEAGADSHSITTLLYKAIGHCDVEIVRMLCAYLHRMGTRVVRFGNEGVDMTAWEYAQRLLERAANETKRQKLEQIVALINDARQK